MISILIKSAEKFDLRKEQIFRWAKKGLKKNKLDNCELSLWFTTPLKIKSLNRKYRDLNESTSVLTFFQGQEIPEKKIFLLGDIVICPLVAKKKNLPIEFLIEHGIKNLLSEIPTAKGS